MTLPQFIQERTRAHPVNTMYRGYNIETYIETAAAKYSVYRYIIFKDGNYVDGGGPFMGRMEKRATAEKAAMKVIDRIIEKGYN